MKKLFTFSIIALFITVSATAQTYTASSSTSVLNWKGKKVTGEHFGKIQLKEGSFTVKNDEVVSGNFVIDMESITVEDLEGKMMEKLVGHLKSDDFFGVATYPEATLVIKGSSKLVDGKAKVKAVLTIKGISNAIEFEATQTDDAFSALVTVDRSLYNVRYGSGKFFDNLGDKTIHDNFTLDVKIKASK